MSGPSHHLNTIDRRERQEQIKRACGYITSNLSIAQVFGVPEGYVSDIRAKLPEDRPKAIETVYGVQTSTYHIDTQTNRDKATKACADHLRALIQYGFDNDSDLGMGRDAFFARAKEIGAMV